MACILKPVANFADLESVRLLLFPSERKPRQHDDDVWVWPTEDREDPSASEANTPVAAKDTSWLQKCEISLSSTTELLVICRNNVMVILTTKWNSQEESEVKSKFHVTWHGNPCQIGEQITSVLCLPLLSQGKSSHCGPDWTCIVAGFSSGFVRFYTENCDLLVSEMLHNEPVKHLKCQTFQTPKYSTSREPTEEIYVVYPSVVCIIPGFGFFQTLRACRNQLARVQANCVEATLPPPLTFKKLGFSAQEVVTDCEVVGKSTENTFDHLMTASVCGGFDSWYRSSAPQTSLVIASGKKPFVGFHYSLEGGSSTPVLADVAKVMANKLKSAIGNVVPTWLSGGRKNVDKPKETSLEPTEAMECRFGLCDNWRHGDGLVISPNRRLSVVCDSLGRVILIDNLKGIAVRMWKGYREAQCGWLEAKEEQRVEVKQRRNVKPKLRTALFLVIYSPKKGIIEIWCMQEGPKVASFSVTKTGRLLYIDYGLVGLNNLQLKGGNNSQTPCIFFDQSGTVKEICVPFHFALCAKNSKRARDFHILKKLKLFLKAEEFNEGALQEEVVKTLEDLTSSEIQLQALQFLSSNQAISPDALWAACNVAVDKWHVASETELQLADPGMKPLSEFTQRLQRTVALYRYLHQLNQRPPDYSTVVDSNLNASVLSEKLLTPQREIDILLNLITTIQALNVKSKARSEGRVTFSSGTQTQFIEFISCFEHCHSDQDDLVVGLKESLLDEELQRTSQLVYQGTLYSDCSIEEWKDAVVKSAVLPAHLMKLALVFWLNRRQGAALEVEMLRFAEILMAICTLADVKVVCVESNEPSLWWQNVRAILSDATDAFMGLTAAIVCRAVALQIEHTKDQVMRKESETAGVDVPLAAAKDLEKSRDSLEALAAPSRNASAEWENVSIDMCQWSVLIGQLEDVALLATVLRLKPSIEKTCPRYCIPFANMDVSLSDILSKGKGSVSELTARWISFSSIDAKHLLDLSDADLEGLDVSTLSCSPNKEKTVAMKEGEQMSVELGADATKSDHVNSNILECISILRRHFPYSLSSSVLLTNVCWEYMLAWHQTFGALAPAIGFLQAVPSSIVKRGLCNLVWTMHLKQRFETAVLLIQKVGKAPKERLILQEVSMSETELQQFFDICQRFFDIFMEVICSSDICGQETFANRSEELWPEDVGGPPSLVDLVLGQRSAEYDVVHLHHQLALTMHTLLVLNVKCTRPLSTLFDNSGQAVFFSDFAAHPNLPSHNPDRKLLDSRCQFLFRAISAAMQLIRLPDYTSETDETPPDPSTAIFWMSKCYSLGADWGVSSDKLRRHQVCELYSSGFDQLAEEIIPAVVDLSLLSSQLMLIVGQRIKYIVSTSSDLGGKISKLSPTLSTWLESLVNNLKNCTCPLADTAQLLVHVLQYLPENHPDYNLALQMVDAVHSFRDSDGS